MVKNSQDADTHLPIVEAVRQQRIFWRNLRLTEIDLIDLEPLQHKATEVAVQLEKRYRFTESRRWQLWCRKSLANGASSIIQWCKRPERELEVSALEAPQAKLQRISKEWSNIWGSTGVSTIKLEDLPTECTPPPSDVPPARSTSRGVELLYTPRWPNNKSAPSARSTRALVEEGRPISSARGGMLGPPIQILLGGVVT